MALLILFRYRTYGRPVLTVLSQPFIIFLMERYGASKRL